VIKLFESRQKLAQLFDRILQAFVFLYLASGLRVKSTARSGGAVVTAALREKERVT
jgi:hypothetical protein